LAFVLALRPIAAPGGDEFIGPRILDFGAGLAAAPLTKIKHAKEHPRQLNDIRQ
jgi:hypothetical protein